MSENVAEQPYDFRRPSSLPAELDGVLSVWTSAFETSLIESWTEILPTAKPTSRGLASISRFELSAEFSPTHLSGRIAVGQIGGQAAVMIDRPAALALVGTMTGDVLENLPEDRELSGLETSLLSLAIEEATAALNESCPLHEPPKFVSLGLETRSDAIRFFSSCDRFLRISMHLEGVCGGIEFSWIFSKVATDTLTEIAKSAPEGSSDGDAFEPLVMEIPVDISVQLGATEIHISDLANLKRGDLLMLHQRVSEPLVGLISGDAKFLGWPGRLGNRLAYQIEDLADGT